MSSSPKLFLYIAPPAPINGLPGNLVWSPISCSLIETSHSAVLVDTAITISQNEELAAWIQQTLGPNRGLTHIYITHGHADHFLGISVLQKLFPSVKVLATQGTIEHMKQQYSPAVYDASWAKWFEGEIPFDEMPLPQPLSPDCEFVIDGHLFHAVDVGHTDTHSSTVLHVPSASVVVAGDVVYGNCHQYLAEAKTPELRREWIAAIDKVATLNVKTVIPGHPGIEQDSSFILEEVEPKTLLDATKRYILDFEEETKNTDDADALFEAMTRRYPNRWNDLILRNGCGAAFT